MTDINKDIEDALYLLEAWERGADVDDYVLNLWYLRQSLDAYKKSQNVESALNGLAETSRDIEPEEKAPVVRWLWASRVGGEWRCHSTFLTDAEAVQHLNYSYLVTKLEFTRQEFPT
jgi:hypothetical protein